MTPLWLRDQVSQNNRKKIDRQKKIPYLKIGRNILFAVPVTHLYLVKSQSKGDKSNELKIHKKQ